MSSVMVCSQRQALAVDPSPQALAPLNAALAVLGITYVFATRVGLEPLTCVELNGQLAERFLDFVRTRAFLNA